MSVRSEIKGKGWGPRHEDIQEDKGKSSIRSHSRYTERWVAKSHARLLYLRERTPLPIDRRLGGVGTSAAIGGCGEEKIATPVGIQTPNRPVRSLLAWTTEISRLHSVFKNVMKSKKDSGFQRR